MGTTPKPCIVKYGHIQEGCPRRAIVLEYLDYHFHPLLPPRTYSLVSTSFAVLPYYPHPSVCTPHLSGTERKTEVVGTIGE